MISLIEGKRAIRRMAERAIRDVWTELLDGPPEDGAVRMEGVEEPETFRGNFYTRTSTLTPEALQNLAGIGLIDDSTAARYRYKGLLFIQVFGKKSVANSYLTTEQLAEALKRKFVGRRDADTGIAFMTARLKDGLPTEKQWYQAQMVAEWEFDEVLSVAG